MLLTSSSDNLKSSCFKFYECLKLNIELGLHQAYENVDIKRALARSIPSNGDDYTCYIKRNIMEHVQRKFNL